MALIRANPLLGSIRGMIGDLVVAQHKPGVNILRRRPVRKAPVTQAEKANRSRMGPAVRWAKAVWAHQPELKARYVAAAQLQHRRGFDLAKSDFLKLPVVEDIDSASYTGKIGEGIRVRARNVFELKSVTVKIRNLSGEILEQGAALLEGGNCWVYTSQVEVPAGQTVTIEAIATDQPLHSASKKIDHACGI